MALGLNGPVVAVLPDFLVSFWVSGGFGAVLFFLYFTIFPLKQHIESL